MNKFILTLAAVVLATASLQAAEAKVATVATAAAACDMGSCCATDGKSAKVAAILKKAKAGAKGAQLLAMR